MGNVRFSYSIEISTELRDKCVTVFDHFDELKTPDDLRDFARTTELIFVRECVPHASEFKYDRLIYKLLNTGRSFLEPAMFDLLDALASRHEGVKGHRCVDLKEELRIAIPKPEDAEQAKDYQQLVQDNVTGNGQGVRAEQGEQWIEAASDNLDELTLRITLAVFNGTSFEVIEEAKNKLLKSLQELIPPPPSPPSTENPPPTGMPVRLMRRLKDAGAEEEEKPPDWKRVIELKKTEIAGEAIGYVWQQYREKEWRRKLSEWVTSYAVNHAVDVRTRAAVAVGRFASKDYRYIRDKVLNEWVRKDDSQHRTAIGMALGVIIRDEKWASEVQSLLKEWAQSEEQAKRWAATRAYIYVGAYCKPVSDVIVQWRNIAASEPVAVDIPIAGNTYVRLTNPLHMSLVDAMLRFFMTIAQMTDEAEKRSLFEGVLKGLKEWSTADGDTRLGLFMFTALGSMLDPVGNEEGERPPLLLQLVEEQPAASAYRKSLGELFHLTLSEAASVTDAKELLCDWVEWIDSLQSNRQVYEARMLALLREIIAADDNGSMRGQLAVCLNDCTENSAAERLLAGF